MKRFTKINGLIGLVMLFVGGLHTPAHAADPATCGVEWQWANPLQNGNSHIAVVYGNDRFVAVGDGGDIITSPDGITWTQRDSGTTNLLWSVAWSGTQFVAVGEKGTIVTSADGVTWTLKSSGTTNALYAVAWGGTEFLIGGENGIRLRSVDGGVTWTINESFKGRYFDGIAWNGKNFVAVGYQIILKEL